MKKIILALVTSLIAFTWISATTIVIKSGNFVFTPKTTTAKVGDTIDFQIAQDHNVVEVTKAIWDANGSASNGGVTLPFGGGKTVMTKSGTFYYVCEPHASGGMKGSITVESVAPPTPAVPTYVIKVSGTFQAFNFQYSPSTVNANVGDTIDFQLNTFHDMVQVTKAAWDKNDSTYIPGMARLPFGGGKIVMTQPGPFYFVCQPHAASMKMKGIINVAGAPTTKVVKFGGTFQANNFQFVPNYLTANVGDTIDFQLNNFHDMIEVTKAGWDNNDSTYTGGLRLPLGGGKVVMTKPGPFYFVCQPHVASMKMKGIVNVTDGLSSVSNTYVSKMGGMQEEFPVVGMASGDIKAVLTGDTLTVSGSFKNLAGDYSASHIHRGYAGTSGPIIFSLKPVLDSTKRSGTYIADSNRIILTVDQKAALIRGEYYTNVHSPVAPAGEMRGQLLAESDAYYQANLTGSQEVPPVLTTAHGSIVATLNGTILTVSGSVKDVQSKINTGIRQGGHIHLAFPGSNGGIQVELKPTLDSTGTAAQYLAADNTFTLTPALIAQLKNGQLYANVHSTTYPGGECRGQITSIGNVRFRAYMTGSQEGTPVSTIANGGLSLLLNDSTLSIVGSFAGLESNFNPNAAGGSHLHKGMAGQNGAIQLGLKVNLSADNKSGTFSGDSNTFKLTASNLDDLFARRLYGNVHTLNFPGGEIRGQIIPECQFVMFGYFNGMQENKPVITTGKGNVVTEINGNKMTLTGYAEKLLDKVNPNIGSHIHFGPVGTNGPIKYTLGLTYPTTDSLSLIYSATNNTFTINSGVIDSLKQRGYYANIHTRKVGSGEVRAQLNGEALIYNHAVLTGAGESTPVNTSAIGGAMTELSSGKGITLFGSFKDLSTKFAANHIHQAISGTNGPVKFTLTSSLSADSLSGVWLPASNAFTLSDGQIDSLRKRMLYANVHTTKNPGGEIRGTLNGMSSAYFIANLSSLNEVFTPSPASGSGIIKAELTGNNLLISGSFAGLSSAFNPNAAGGSHLHNGVNGQNGGISVSLKAAINADGKSGFFVPDSNTVTLTSDQLTTLLANGLYANIHSTGNPGGEIRGQVLAEPNNFPGSTTIINPKNGDTIKADLKFKDSLAVFNWTAASDPDGHPVVYRIQTTTPLTPDFSFLLTNVSTGAINAFALPFRTIDSLLAANGIPLGGGVTIPARVVVSDGSLNTLGTPILVTLARGLTVGVSDQFIKSFSMAVYPVPANQYAYLEINATRNASTDLRIIDLSGRILESTKLNILKGFNQFNLDVSKYQAGNYFLQIFEKGQQMAYFKMIKQ